MSEHRESLARGGLARVAELCRAGLEPHAFRRALRPVLERALGFDGYCVNLVDPETLVVTSSVGDGLDGTRARRLFALEHQGGDHNLLRELAVSATSVASLSETTAGRIEQSRRMRELFRPLGYTDELRAALRVDGRCWGYLHLFRAQGGRFAARDVAFVARLGERLAAALRDGVQNLLTHGRHAFEPAVVVARRRAQREGDAADRARRDGDAAARVRHELDDVPGATLPHVAHDFTFCTRSARGATVNGVGRSGVALEFRAIEVGRTSALLVAQARPAAFERLLFAAARLSSREREVATLLARGATNEELALALSIGLYTAKDHVSAVFTKLGVTSRVELLVALRST